MRNAILAAGAFVLASGADAQQPDEDQAVSAMIEWTVANCGMDGISPMHLMMAQMIADGTDPAEMAQVREKVRARIGEQFETIEEACVDLKGHFLGQ